MALLPVEAEAHSFRGHLTIVGDAGGTTTVVGSGSNGFCSVTAGARATAGGWADMTLAPSTACGASQLPAGVYSVKVTNGMSPSDCNHDGLLIGQMAINSAGAGGPYRAALPPTLQPNSNGFRTTLCLDSVSSDTGIGGPVEIVDGSVESLTRTTGVVWPSSRVMWMGLSPVSGMVRFVLSTRRDQPLLPRRSLSACLRQAAEELSECPQVTMRSRSSRMAT